jgi:copper transport protein
MRSPADVCRVLAAGPATALALVLGLVAGGALVLGTASPAAAHATLIGSVPADDSDVDGVPATVQLQFDEPVDALDDAVLVYGPDGERVDLGTVELADGGATVLAPIEGDAEGTYTVAWRVSSEDSHTISGSLVFHNGARTGAVEVDDSDDVATQIAGLVGRWLAFAGAFAAVGAALVAGVVTRRDATPPGDADASGGRGAGIEADRPAGDGGAGAAGTATLTHAETAAAPGAATGPGRALGRLRLLAGGGAAAGAIGAFVVLLAIVAESTGRSLPDALSLRSDLATESRTNELAQLRVVRVVGAAVCAAIGPLWRRSRIPTLVLAAGSLVAASLAGHAWTAPDRAIAVVTDLVHLGAVAVWIGGILALLLALPVLGQADRMRAATRFSAVALGAVVVLALSGTVSGWQQLGALGDLTSTAYGQLLLLKVVGFLALVGFGVANRTRLIPLLDRTVGPLERSLRGEVAVAALVLVVTAGLVQQPPARTETAAGPYETTVTAETGEVLTAFVEPAEAGANDLHLYFSGPAGAAAMDAVQVTAATGDVPARSLQVIPVTPDHVTVAGASLPSPGTWTIEVTAVQAGVPLVFTFEVPIA